MSDPRSTAALCVTIILMVTIHGCRSLHSNNITRALRVASDVMDAALDFPDEAAASERSRTGVWQLPSGAEYSGEVSDGRPHGQGILNYHGWNYMGSFHSGKLHGLGTLRSPSGFEFRGHRENGVAFFRETR